MENLLSFWVYESESAGLHGRALRALTGTANIDRAPRDRAGFAHKAAIVVCSCAFSVALRALA